MNKAAQSKWHHLPDVYVRLHKDELGYPPKDWEQLKAEPTHEANTYRLKSIPFYARGLALEDEVLTRPSFEGYSPVITSVVKRSGFSTIRLSIPRTEDPNTIIQYFTKRGVQIEFAGSLVALAIPSHVFDEVSDYICDEKERGRWDAEDGFLIIDESD